MNSPLGDDIRFIRSALEQFETKLIRYAQHVLAGDAERARDVVQDTFLRLCRAERQQVEDHLAEWLYTVCRNRALDVRRKEIRMKSMSTEQQSQQGSREPDHVVQAEQNDLAARILEIVDGFSDNQREAVRLKFQHGLTYREISKITNLSISNIGFLIHTALDKVRRQLDIPAEPSS